MNSRAISLTLPIPNRALSPNARPHWRVVAKAKKAAKALTAALAREAMTGPAPRWKRAWIDVTWYTKTPQRPDEDNARASLKAHYDGLQDAEVIENDRELKTRTSTFGVDCENPRVILTVVERLEPDSGQAG